MGARWERAIAGAAAVVLGVAGGAGILASVVGATPAASAAIASYQVTGSGTGLKVTLGGTSLVGGTSSVSAGTGAPVVAKAAGELTPQVVAAVQATATSPGTSETLAQRCDQPSTAPPAPLGTVVHLGLSCAAASAARSTSDMPTATSAGKVGTLNLTPAASGTTASSALSSVLPTTVLPNSALAGQLTSILGTMPSLPASGLPLGTVLRQVAKSTSGTAVTSLASTTVGPTTSTLATTGDVVTASVKSTGATVDLLGGAGAGGGPLLKVHVGQADAIVHVDTATGTTTAQATGAAVTVTIAPPAGTAQTISIAPGGSKSFLTGTPLQTTVVVGASSTTAAKGTATANGVEIDLATGAGATNAAGSNGGVQLVLGQATVAGSGPAPAVATAAGSTPTASSRLGSSNGAAQTPSGTLTGATTVHTGEPWSGMLPIALLSMSLLAGLGLVARRQLVAVVHLAGRTTGRVARAVRPVSRGSAGPGLRDLLRSPSGSGPGSAAHHFGPAGREDD